MAPHIDDHLDEAWKLLAQLADADSYDMGMAYSLKALAHIQLWHAERIRKFEQAQEEWHRKQRENTPPPPPMPHPGYVGF
jgi:hypothetical protein